MDKRRIVIGAETLWLHVADDRQTGVIGQCHQFRNIQGQDDLGDFRERQKLSDEPRHHVAMPVADDGNRDQANPRDDSGTERNALTP